MSPAKNAPLTVLHQLAANWFDLEVAKADSTIARLAELLKPATAPEAFLEASLGAGALPKFESEGGAHILLLRVFDEAADRRAENARSLTRKISVLILPTGVYTIHHFPTPEIPKIFTPKLGVICDPAVTIPAEETVNYILERTIATFADAIRATEEEVDAMETAVFKPTSTKPFRIKDAYLLKRRLSTQKKMLEMNREALEGAARVFPALSKSIAKRKLGRAIGAADALIEGLNHLLQLHLALVSQKTNEASQRTNEVMRILTVFSAFFLPLSFIAGVYGMNFENMPELHHPHGYAVTLGIMGAVALVIWIWFRKRGWIGNPPA